MADESTGDSDIVAEARKRFQRAQTFYEASRILSIADTQFAMGDSDNGWQWPELITRVRTADAKVILTVNLTAQHCNQVINQIRQNKPTAKVSPVDDRADKKTAEILSGLLRNIQAVSNADDAHDVGAEHAIYGGEGYWRVLTDFESETSFDQEILIGPCPNPNLVFVDPDAKELDKSDAEWGFIFEDISKEQFKREYPDIEPADWDGAAMMSSGWVGTDTVRRAEYLYCTYVKDTALLLEDGRSVLKSTMPEGAKYQKPGRQIPGSVTLPDGTTVIVTKERPTERKEWKWCKLIGGHDSPVDEQVWPGDYLPIISVLGKELNVNGAIVRKGLVRDLKDPARMVNYAYSETVQTIALQNRVPYMAAKEATEGFETTWNQANVQNLAVLPYNAFTDEADGTRMPIPAPVKQPPPIMPTAQVQLLQLSTEQMRAASGQQNSNFGIRSEASSGIGIERLKVQGEVATFHFPDNLRRALQYEAKVVINLIQKIYDTKRVVRILGLDGKEEHATLDPEMQQPYMENDEGEAIQRIFNPMVGKYDVVINTGPTFQTQRQEAFATLIELATKDPRVMQIAGDLVMKAADFPMSEQLAERFAKAMPPELRDEKKGQPAPDPMIAQLDQAMQGMDQHIQQLEQENAALKQAEANKQGELAIKNDANYIDDKEADAKMIEAQAADKEADAKVMEAQADLIRARAEADAAIMQAQQPLPLAPEAPEVDLAPLQMQLAEIAGALQIMQTREVEPPRPTQKTISIRAPSGAVYEGVVSEQ